jgi:hypothetical protein
VDWIVGVKVCRLLRENRIDGFDRADDDIAVTVKLSPELQVETFVFRA